MCNEIWMCTFNFNVQWLLICYFIILVAYSAYTEVYKVRSVAAGPLTASVGDARADEEDQGRTSEEEGCAADSNYNRQVRFWAHFMSLSHILFWDQS